MQALLVLCERDDFDSLLEDSASVAYRGGSLLSQLYAKVANAYRRKHCRYPDGSPVRMLKDGELHPLCANWMGPGTDIEAASKYPSFNAADDVARVHDYAYMNAMKKENTGSRARLIRQADNEMIEALKKTNDPPYTQLGLQGINTKVRVENLLGQSIKKFGVPEQYIGSDIA